jgi:hypothetical protein
MTPSIGIKSYVTDSFEIINSGIKNKTSDFTENFFKKITKSECHNGCIKKPFILSSSIKGKIISLFIKILWGGSYLKVFKEEAREKFFEILDKNPSSSPSAYENAKNTIENSRPQRELHAEKGANRFKNGLPAGYQNQITDEVQNFKKVPSPDVAKIHLNDIKKNGDKLANIASGDGKEWIAIRVIKEKKVDPGESPYKACEGEVCPTSERALNISNDLNNIYMHVSEDGHLSITCGVIDTEEKAEQFMCVVVYALEKNSGLHGKPLRINMHQLNSMGSGPAVLVSEHSLVTKQHLMANYINANLEKGLKDKKFGLMGNGPFVSHVNRCLNGFTQIKGEDEKSHPVNREGVAIQMGWFISDLEDDFKDIPIELKTQQGEINATISKLQEARLSLNEFETLINSQNSKHANFKRIAKTEAEIIKINIRISDLSEEHRDELSPLLAKRKEIIEKLVSNEYREADDYNKLLKGEKTITELLEEYSTLLIKIEDVKNYNIPINQSFSKENVENGDFVEQMKDLVEKEVVKCEAIIAKQKQYEEEKGNIIKKKTSLESVGEVPIQTVEVGIAKEIVKLQKNSIKILEKQLDEQLSKLAVSMNTFRCGLEKPITDVDVKKKELKTHVTIAAQLLSIQTGKAGEAGFPPKLTPSQELSYQLLFDHVLKTVTEINCKSGLDRTGFARSLHNAIQQKLEKEPLEKVMNFLHNFEQRIHKMDKSSVCIENLEEKYKGIDKKGHLNNLVDEWEKKYVEEREFQKAVFAELMGVALPITRRSTGLTGLKWHHDKKSINPFEKNPHPLPFLPRSVVGDNKEKVRLINFKKGKSFLTQKANMLLMGLSSYRGG